VDDDESTPPPSADGQPGGTSSPFGDGAPANAPGVAPPGWQPPIPGWQPPVPGWQAPPPGWQPPVSGWQPPPQGWQPPPIWSAPPPGWQPPPQGVPVWAWGPPVIGSGRFRAQSFGELLDATFTLYRRKFLTIISIAALFQLPYVALQYFGER
jgi:hypothetical protein